ncbi:MAG TPA: hypothetical protein VN969_01745 [Streptosporangiaceae bacterium]|nr:hypothetical protein [Streptosporangiaceae bacterium]
MKLARTLSRFTDVSCATLGGGRPTAGPKPLNAQINAPHHPLITRARGFRGAATLIAIAEFVHGGWINPVPESLGSLLPSASSSPSAME